MSGPVSPEATTPFAEWVRRVATTHDAVAYTCRVRLGDAAAGEAVAAHVVAGLVARPAVFRYWGLPFSGRIARLAEEAIAAVGTGTLSPPPWPALRRELEALPADVQQVLVWICVDGWSDAELAAALGCGESEAGVHRERTVARLRALVGADVGRR
ncbi:hypothetical protein Acsp06_50640 [Actinomycetospora sp. NBRC 106375]|uniref:RNA polymerase sigma factor n=1 Tax=Actinomycetospora sp. NBRC 106375 TaxID=3032207 RepID=UPI0024A157DD|nr:sigma factor-like helix-turn-helix DNA-binding protein [Actinomycetospora sp. NBRC 106375]GLZ48879.1 hypothetical protein Acsp06_50640 [Actinomycetospora sp. NBRC 106375]